MSLYHPIKKSFVSLKRKLENHNYFVSWFILIFSRTGRPAVETSWTKDDFKGTNEYKIRTEHTIGAQVRVSTLTDDVKFYALGSPLADNFYLSI